MNRYGYHVLLSIRERKAVARFSYFHLTVLHQKHTIDAFEPFICRTLVIVFLLEANDVKHLFNELHLNIMPTIAAEVLVDNNVRAIIGFDGLKTVNAVINASGRISELYAQKLGLDKRSFVSGCYGFFCVPQETNARTIVMLSNIIRTPLIVRSFLQI